MTNTTPFVWENKYNCFANVFNCSKQTCAYTAVIKFWFKADDCKTKKRDLMPTLLLLKPTTCTFCKNRVHMKKNVIALNLLSYIIPFKTGKYAFPSDIN
jgi:hypothetical protein